MIAVAELAAAFDAPPISVMSWGLLGKRGLLRPVRYRRSVVVICLSGKGFPPGGKNENITAIGNAVAYDWPLEPSLRRWLAELIQLGSLPLVGGTMGNYESAT